MSVGVVQKAFVIPPRFRTFRNPGQVPSRENIELMRLAKKAPEAFTIARLLAHDQPMLSVGSIVKGLGFSMTQANGLERFLGKAMQSTNEVVLRKTILDKCQQEQFDGAVRSAIMQRSLTYWRETKKSLVQVVSPDDFHKGLFIGPRGGRWADAAHTIPHVEAPSKKQMKRKLEIKPKKSAIDLIGDEIPKKRWDADMAKEKLVEWGNSLYAAQHGMHNVIDDVGLNKYDYSAWESVRGNLDAMRSMLRKYKRQIIDQADLGYYHAGLSDLPKASRVRPRLHSTWGSLLMPVDGRVTRKVFEEYKALQKKFGLRWDSGNTAWYVPRDGVAKFEFKKYQSEMAELDIAVDEPSGGWPIAQAPTAAKPTLTIPITAYDVKKGIASRRIKNAAAVIMDPDGKITFYAPYSDQFNKLFNNKSGMLTGITKYNPDNHGRETYNLDLAEEAIEKLKGLIPEWEIVTAGIKEARINKDQDLAELQKPIPGVQEKLAIGHKLFPYQNECVRFLDGNNGNAIIGDQMGLGKTMQTLAWAAKNNKKLLVVCPKVVRRTWIQEAAKFFPDHFKGVELEPTMLRKNKVPDFSNINIATVNYESLGKFEDVIKSAGFDTIVVDESHRMKNPKAKATQNIQRIGKPMKHKILLSGTAVKNKREELVTQLDFVAPGEHTEMRDKYDLYGRHSRKLELKERTIGGIWVGMRKNYLARLKSVVLKDLPEKTTSVMSLPVKNAPDIAENVDLGEYSRIKAAVAVAKIPITKEVVREILDSSDSKVLVFTCSVEAAKALAKEFGDEALLHIGETKDEARESAKAEFQKQDAAGNFISKKRVLIGTQQTMGLGATLTAADKVVFNDLPWTAADVEQAEDRTHRPGQKNAVNVYWVTAENNMFDGIVSNILFRKYELSKKLNQGKQLSPEENAWMKTELSMNEVFNQLRGLQAGPQFSETEGPKTTDDLVDKSERYLLNLEKAWGHKYISKKPDGKGGWVYVYPEDKPHPKGQKVFIIDMTKPKPHVLGEEKPSGGTKDPKQLGLFMTKETSKQLGLFTAKVKSKPKVEDKPVAKPVEKLIIREPVKELDVKAEAPEPASVPKDEKEIKKIKAKTKITPTKEEAEKIAREIGEHVWGSRKDLAVIRSSEDLVSMSPGNQAKVATKQYLMPKWDYADLVDSGVDPEAVLVRKAFESCIMAKAPDNLEGRKAYVDGIDFVTRSLDKCKTVKDIHDFVYDWKQLSRSKKLLKSLTVDEVQKIYDEYRESVGSPVKMGWLARKEWRQELKDANSRYYKNEIAASDYIDLKNTAKEAGYKDYSFSHITEAVSWKVGVDDIALEFSGSKYSIYHHDPELKGTSVVIAGRTRNVNKYGFMAAAMGTRIVKALSNSYSTGFYREAPKTLRTAEKIGDSWETQKLSEDEKYDALVDVMEPKKREGKEKRPRFKWERNVPGEINRVGGKPVLTADTQALADIFKFKDIQFGEWVSEEDAESHVKGVHGAFLDLADVLGIDPQTVSMNGRLSISVGARGRGAAKAHYEPGGKIINITKRAGGGSVAHEWAHAMDHLVSIAYHPSSKEMPMLSAKDTIGVAPSVVEAMNEVMQNINYEAPSEAYKAVATEGQVLEKRYRAGERLNYEEQVTLRTYYRERSKVTKSDYLKDASSFSQSADSYWTRPHELFARAFEAAIEDILTDQNRVSSYLVSSTKEIYRTGRYQSDADYKDDKHAQIYPQGETRKRITESVKKLVEALRKDKSLEKAMHYLLDLEKAEVRGGKYHKRIPKKSGKGYQYIYEPESYDSREDAHVDGKQASKAYLNNQVSKCVLKAGEKGCDVAAFKPLVKKFGSKSVAGILQEQQTGGKFVFKKGRFYAPKPEKEKL